MGFNDVVPILFGRALDVDRLRFAFWGAAPGGGGLRHGLQSTLDTAASELAPLPTSIIFRHPRLRHWARRGFRYRSACGAALSLPFSSCRTRSALPSLPPPAVSLGGYMDFKIKQ